MSEQQNRSQAPRAPRPIPRLITVPAEIYRKDLDRIDKLSLSTGMHQDEVVAVIVEGALEGLKQPAVFTNPWPPEDRGDAGESVAAASPPASCESAAVVPFYVTPKLNRKLVELSRLSGLSKGTIAGLLVEETDTDALLPAKDSLSELHTLRCQNLESWELNP